MKNHLALLLCLYLAVAFSGSAQAKPQESLFFHKEEIQQINQKMRQLPATKLTKPKHLIPLESILYLGPNDWVVWMQGRKWTPETQHASMKIIQVMPTALRLTAKLQNGAVITRTLVPHQSLNLLTGEVIEGG